MHWDHTQGLPFFAAGNSAGSRVDLYVPAQGDTESILGRFMSPPHFPIPPSDLAGSWTFNGLEPGEAEIGAFSVLALEIPHKGGRAFGYRISDGRATYRLSLRPLPDEPRSGTNWPRGVPRGGPCSCRWLRRALPRRPVHRRGTAGARLLRSRLLGLRRRACGDCGGGTAAALPPRPGPDRRRDRLDRKQLQGCQRAGGSCGAGNYSGLVLTRSARHKRAPVVIRRRQLATRLPM